MKTKKSFNFSHMYDKFGNKSFTTIRGRSAFWNYSDSQDVDILLRGGFIFKARIYHKKQIKIKKIPLDILKADAEYGELKINSCADFIKLINSFRRFHKLESEEDFVTIFWLIKK